MDLVGTCPRRFWTTWLDEGSCAGDADSGVEYAWWTKSKAVLKLQRGDRLYVVAAGKLRGWAPVVRIIQQEDSQGRPIFGVCRKGGAVACTIEQDIPGFRGLRKRFWERSQEIPFPDWKTR